MEERNPSDYIELSGFEEVFDDRVSENIASKCPGIISVEGEWGSGKSRFLWEWEKKAKSRHPEWIIINYNAWENDGFGEGLMPLLLRLSSSLGEESKKGGFDSEKKRRIAGEMLVAAGEVMKMSGILSGVGSILDTVGNTIKSGFDFSDEEKANPLFAEASNYTKLYDAIGDSMSRYIDDMHRIVLVIDDLDRCLPQHQLQILESIHHISERCPLLTIMAFDPEQLTECLRTIYGPDRCDQYFGKIFNCRLPISGEASAMLAADLCSAFWNLLSLDSGWETVQRKYFNLFQSFVGKDFPRIISSYLSPRQMKKAKAMAKAVSCLENIKELGPNDVLAVAISVCIYAKEGDQLTRSLNALRWDSFQKLGEVSAVLSSEKQEISNEKKNDVFQSTSAFLRNIGEASDLLPDEYYTAYALTIEDLLLESLESFWEGEPKLPRNSGPFTPQDLTIEKLAIETCALPTGDAFIH